MGQTFFSQLLENAENTSDILESLQENAGSKAFKNLTTTREESESPPFEEQSTGRADLTAEMETMAQRRSSMDDSFHLPNFPHMARASSSALPTIVMMPSLKAQLEFILSHRLYNCTLVSQRVPNQSVISQGRCLTSREATTRWLK